MVPFALLLFIFMKIATTAGMSWFIIYIFNKSSQAKDDNWSQRLMPIQSEGARAPSDFWAK